MKVATNLALCLVASLSVGNVASQFQQYSFKCSNDIFMCGGLKREQVCNNAGTDKNGQYIPANEEECKGMIAATKQSGTFSYKCPNNRAISHYVVYGCGGGLGMKYEGGAGETCPCPSGSCGNGKGCGDGVTGGDPHFKTYDGSMFSFHGECDLLLVRSSNFGDGLGIEVHARTQMIDDWSLVSSAAIRVGDDIFEIVNDETFYVNGTPGDAFPFTMAGRYEVTRTEEEVESEGEIVVRIWYNVDLTDGHSVKISNWKSMLSVNVEVPHGDAYGMLGTSTKAGLVGRDGDHVGDDTNEMGLHWQVTDMEPMLFHEAREPQFPTQCRLPEVSKRRLRLAEGDHRRALKACAAVTDETLLKFCIEDVILTGDSSAAATYGSVF